MTATRTRWLIQFASSGRFLALDPADPGSKWWSSKPEAALQAVDPIALARRVRQLMPHAGDALRLVAVRFSLISHNPPRWCADE